MNNVTDVNANATESLIYAPRINMLKSPFCESEVPSANANRGGPFQPLRNHAITSHVQMMRGGAPTAFRDPSVPPPDQQSVTDKASPASLVSLYLLFMSLAV